MKVVVEFDLFEDFDHEIYAAQIALHISFESDVRVHAALPQVAFQQLQEVLEHSVDLRSLSGLRSASVEFNRAQKLLDGPHSL